MKYYISATPENGRLGSFKEASIGWRWCKDSKPERTMKYNCVNPNGIKLYLLYNVDWDSWMDGEGMFYTIVQWLEAPELTADNKEPKLKIRELKKEVKRITLLLINRKDAGV